MPSPVPAAPRPDASAPSANEESSAPHPTVSHFPRLTLAEWATFGVLAALLAVTNIYTALLTGWGDGGSIIAVLAAVAVLGVISKRKPNIISLNLGQTMASAGGSVGFAVSFYAAVKLVQPEFQPHPVVFTLLFIGMGLIGTLVGASVRKYLIHYFFPSGTACAVIQRTVTSSGEQAARPVRLLAVGSLISAALTLPSKISLTSGGAALLQAVPLGWRGLAIGLDPLLYGIGLVVGPRIGLGMILGALAGPLLIIPRLTAAGVATELHGDWIRWTAISVLTLPTFAAILFAYLFRSPTIVPPGFSPGAIHYGPPPARRLVYGAVALLGVLLTALTANQVFGVSFHLSVLTVVVAWPLCIMNGRVTGDTDINPVRLVAVVLLTLFATLLASGPVVLLGIAIIGGTLAAIGVDMMQDYRTGYLLGANPAHQTTVQVIGTIVGALVAVPFVLVLDARLGFGPGQPLPAPGAQIWAAMAQAFASGGALPAGLVMAIVAISVVGSLYALLTVWPTTAPWMPSLFGIGIGLLLPFEMSAAIFLGGLLKLASSGVSMRGTQDAARQAAKLQASNDTMLIGSAIFAASAVVSVGLVLLTSLMARLGIGGFYLAH